jgi:hypothetical protein
MNEIKIPAKFDVQIFVDIFKDGIGDWTTEKMAFLRLGHFKLGRLTCSEKLFSFLNKVCSR